jgi:surface polysaccharide O-acyltransferase-like enzyme
MKASNENRTRLHYLDWIRVLAIFGVFIFHTARPFDFIDWAVKNSELSLPATIFVVFLYPWGMPLFFMISGAGTYFALKRRSYTQYTVERVKRLLIPYIIGSMLLTPIQGYYEIIHKKLYSGTFFDFITHGKVLQYFIVRFRDVGWNPRIFGAGGFHLWFLGFLFLYSLMAIPIFRWLSSENGSRFTDFLVKLVSKPVGIILWVIPLSLTQIVLNPYFPIQNDWADFLYQFLFFVYGYILFSDQRFLKALKKDWWLILFLSFISSVLILSTVSSGFTDSISVPQNLTALLIRWGVYSINSWAWIISLIIFGMRYLDYENNWLKYLKQAVMPFYLIHHPVIIAIAYYVVQWDTSTVIKILSVICGSFLTTLGIFELLIKRISPLGNLLGLKHNARTQ